MKIILTSIGTRGDMEPFLAIAEILKEKGHQVICMFPEQFRELSEESGFEFRSLGSRFIEMLDSPAGKTVMGGGKFGIKKLRAYLQLINMQKDIHKEMVLIQEAEIEKIKPDRIVHNAKVIYPIIWGINNKNKTIFVSPVPYLHYVKDQAHIAFNNNFGPFINKLSYSLANFGLIKTILSSRKWLPSHSDIGTKDIKKALFENKAIYTVSPSLFSRPEYWPDNLQVLGFHERKKTVNWTASDELKNFLRSHPKVIMVTFGSMINSEPHQKTKVILDVLDKLQIPAIINTAAGGLIEPEVYDSSKIHFVNRIPYDWVFPKLYAVIHHGGSGTTHTALKYGCPSLILPHIIDQYVWNKIIHEKGIGPMGIDISRISVSNLEAKVIDLYSNNLYLKKATELSKQIQNESFVDDIYMMITQ